MNIGPSSNVALIPAGPREKADEVQRHRRDGTLRARPDFDIERLTSRLDTADTAFATDKANPPIANRVVEPLLAAEEGRLKKQRDVNELPRENQLAINVYNKNQFSQNERREGGELVGIDLFV